MAKSTNLSAVFLLMGIVWSLGSGGVVERAQGQQLRLDFYSDTCSSAETIVRSTMQLHFRRDPAIAAQLLRLFFHDCAATGCDASLLLKGDQSEQAAGSNLSVLGYEVIDDIKAQLEAACPETVSCADIVALAARDAVSLTGGPNFSVPLGRFDSLVSGGINVNLPSGDSTVSDTVGIFQNLGLNATDLAILLGAHTIGLAHCSSFSNHMYNFQGTGQANPNINATFLARLQQICPQSTANPNTTVPLDGMSLSSFDSGWYSEIAQGRGLLALDQGLVNSTLTSDTMRQMALDQTFFFQSFAASMIKLGGIGIKDSTTGTIRTDCGVVDAPAPLGSPALAPEAPPPTAGAD